MWMESKSLLWEGKEDGKLLPPSPSLSWENGLHGFVEFGDSWDREGLSFQHKHHPHLAAGQGEERSNNLPKISSAGQQQSWE